ncbi:MAG: autotransporter domain-containing protein, partial [Candidatus Methylumidiphilus sp.]
ATLDVQSSETIGALAGAAGALVKLNGNTLTAGDAHDSEFAGALSGTGGLDKQGAGTLTLSGANNYTGQTHIGAGTLALQNADAIAASSQVSVGAGGGLALGSDQTLAQLTSAGGASVNLNGHTLATASANLSGGQLQGTGTLDMGGGTLTVDGAVTLGSGVTVSNAGQALIAANGQLGGAGQYVQTAGQTQVDGTLAVASTQLQGGVLRGSGTVAGTLANAATIQGDGAAGLTLAGDVKGAGGYTGLVNFAGAFSPGNSPALIHAENLNFTSTSRLLMELGGLARGTEYDAIDAQTVKLGGALDVQLINGFVPKAGNQFDLIRAQSITGAFNAPFVCPDTYVGECRLSNDGANLSLLFLPTNPAPVRAAEDILPAPAQARLTPLLFQPGGKALYDYAIEQIKPRQASNLTALSTLTANIQVNNITQHLMNWRSSLRSQNQAMQAVGLNINGMSLPGLWPAQAAGGGAGDGDDDWLSRLGGFANGRFEFDNRSTTALQRGYNANIYAFTAGVDYWVSKRFLVGLAAVYNYTDNRLNGQGGAQYVNGYGMTGFASLYLTDHWYVDMMANGTYNEYSSKRNIAYVDAVGPVNTTAYGHTDGLQSHYSVNTGYEFPVKEWTFGVRARTEYINTPVGGFSESGALLGLNLSYPYRSVDSLTSTLGGILSHTASTPVGVFVSQLVLEWEHQYMNNVPVNGVSFIGDPARAFNNAVDSPGRDYCNIRTSVSAQLADGASAFIQYDTTLGVDNFSRNAVNVGLRMEF